MASIPFILPVSHLNTEGVRQAGRTCDGIYIFQSKIGDNVPKQNAAYSDETCYNNRWSRRSFFEIQPKHLEYFL